MRKRAQRQAVSDRAVARDEMQRAAAGFPSLAAPADPFRFRLPALNGEHIAGRLG